MGVFNRQSRFVPTATLRVEGGLCAISPVSSRPSVRLSVPLLIALECFAETSDVHAARELFDRRIAASPCIPADTLVGRALNQESLDGTEFRLQPSRLVWFRSAKQYHRLDELARECPAGVLAAVATRLNVDGHAEILPFEGAVDRLVELGLLTIAVGQIQWGDLARASPMCDFFGRSRGTSVDRYYLTKFVEKHREHVVGKTLEIGGLRTNKAQYQFPVDEYVAVDLEPGPLVDVVGDVHDPALFDAHAFDSVVAFNVLEHCPEPQRVVDNMARWLKPGGRAFTMTPAAQRVHLTPADFWRPMPQGLGFLFRHFAHVDVVAYGNLMTMIASLAGIAREELTPEQLDAHHPDFPVAVCVSAQKH